MTGDGFERRGEGFETKFEKEQDQRFLVMARRDKIFARWAAELMGIEGDAVEAYEKEVVSAALEEAGDQDILRKVGGDLEAKGKGMSEGELQAQLDRCFQEASQSN